MGRINNGTDIDKNFPPLNPANPMTTDRKMIQRLGPLDLQNHLIPNTGNIFKPQCSVLLSIRMLEIFHRFKLLETSNTDLEMIGLIKKMGF